MNKPGETGGCAGKSSAARGEPISRRRAKSTHALAELPRRDLNAAGCFEMGRAGFAGKSESPLRASSPLQQLLHGALGPILR
jgi:hypothetical protein